MYYVYILASRPGGVLYIGVTSNLMKRLGEHRSGTADSFTKRYNITRLVYYEESANIVSAIEREKQLKKWNRTWKDRLIAENNPQWNDLTDSL